MIRDVCHSQGFTENLRSQIATISQTLRRDRREVHFVLFTYSLCPVTEIGSHMTACVCHSDENTNCVTHSLHKVCMWMDRTVTFRTPQALNRALNGQDPRTTVLDAVHYVESIVLFFLLHNVCWMCVEY